jgi:hypothetical protein
MEEKQEKVSDEKRRFFIGALQVIHEIKHIIEFIGVQKKSISFSSFSVVPTI